MSNKYFPIQNNQSLPFISKPEIYKNIFSVHFDDSIEKKSPFVTEETIDFLTGRFDYKSHPLFARVPDSISDKEIFVQLEVLEQYTKMFIAARKDNVILKIISGTRNFEEQKNIWNKKWKKISKSSKDSTEIALNIMAYSSMPSTSRHHWGTDIDINSLAINYYRSPYGKKVYSWLQNNAEKFGFKQVYTDKTLNNRTGYKEEKWHWSYVPLSNKYLQDYVKSVNFDHINGFTGFEVAKKIDVINNYVKGINF
ncbi:MAG: D-alanyl-D-alanine carboxypeptidase family protein [Ferruginibacter sp.]|nr:D-alanyl-D-alanine carboxypeptidase family protein [Ferruginibacter sp.]